MSGTRNIFCRVALLLATLFLALPLVHASIPPLDKVLNSQSFPVGSTTAVALTTLTTEGSVTVPASAEVIFKAGTSITLGSGFSVQAGGNFTATVAEIDTDGDGMSDFDELVMGSNPEFSEPPSNTRVPTTVLSPVPRNKPASYPSWWFERSIIPRKSTDANITNPEWPQNYPLAEDYAVANVGQLKNFAYKATAEINARFPSTGAGPALKGMIASWFADPVTGLVRDDYKLVNLGQLKNLAKLFYDQLNLNGYTGLPLSGSNIYPWSPVTTDDDDYATANIGQLKYVFSFNIPAYLMLDSDGDGWDNIGELNLGLDPRVAGPNDFSGAAVGNTPVATLPFNDSAVIRQATNPRRDAANNELLVGATAGSLGVDDSGASVYTVPLSIPAGSNGMQPSLALKYSSNNPNGLMGLGWSLQGLSVITRGASNKDLHPVNDTVSDSVDLQADDRFFIDGQRLISTLGTYGAASSEYHTQSESFSKIIAKSVIGTGPESFEVWTKSGLRMEYGKTSDARLVNGSVVLWLVNRVEDRDGNYYTITYQNHPNSTTPRVYQINYTGNAGLAPYNTVEFIYEPRADSIQQFTFGTTLLVSERLKRIDFKHASAGVPLTTLRSYEFNYQTQAYTNRSRLTSLQEIGLNNKRLPATTFAWSDASVGYTQVLQTPITNIGKVQNYYYMADFNGDGLTDIVEIIDNDTDRTLNVSMNTGGAFSALPSVALRANNTQPTNNPYYGLSNVNVGDYNGDGLSDILLGYKSVSILTYDDSEISTNVTFELSLAIKDASGNISFSSPVGGLSFANTRAFNGSTTPPVRLVGVSASGGAQNKGSSRAQILVNWKDGNNVSYWELRRFDGSWLTTYTGATNSVLFSDRIYGLESTGDGISDLLVRNTGGSTSILSPGKNGYASLQNAAYPTIGATHALMPGDYNGDGLSDIMRFTDFVYSTITSQWTGDGATIFQGSGNGIQQTAVTLNGGDLSYIKFRQNYTFDINGDGRQDIMFVDRKTPAGYPAFPSGFSGIKILLADSVNTGGLSFRQLDLNIANLPSIDDQNVESITFNRDSFKDLFVLRGTAPYSWRILQANAPTNPPDLLTTITDGLGQSSTIAYSTLLDPTVYTPGAAATGLVNLQNAQPVVKTLTRDNGPAWNGSTNVASTYVETYKYEGLRGEPGRGISGFAAQESTDSRTNVTTRVERRQDYPYTGFVTRTQTKRGSAILSDTVNTPTLRWLRWGNADDRTFFTFASATTTSAYDLPTATAAADKLATASVLVSTTTATQTYDDYGNPLVTTTNHGFGGRVLTQTVDYYPTDTADWLIARPQKSTTVAVATGQPTITRTLDYTYQPTGNRLRLNTITSDAADPAVSVVTTYSDYDTFGHARNLSAVGRVDATTNQTRSRTVLWDTLGRFPSTVRNALNQEQTFVYNQLLGVPSSSTDANALTTTFTYDAFGRLETSTYPDNSISTSTLRWTANDDGFAQESKTTSADGTRFSSPPAVTIYDRQARPLRQSTLNADGKIIWSDTRYGPLGQPLQTSAPYIVGEPIQWTTVAYDGLGRPWRTTTPNAVQTDTTYNGLTTDQITTSVYEGTTLTRHTRQTTDPLGQVLTVIQNPNLATNHAEYSAVTTTYDALGQVAVTTNPGGSQITLASTDTRGLATSMTDPNAGTWNYRTNAFGDLYEQKDAKSQATRYTYDVIGRQVTRTEDADGTASMLTTWVYDTATGKGKGQLASVSGSDAAGGTTSETYTYDTLGRPLANTRTINGATYTTQVTNYDSLSLPTGTRRTANTGTVIDTFNQTTAYNAYGFARELRDADAGTILWSLGTVNAYGQPVTDYSGSGLTTTRTFDPVDATLRQIRTGRADGVDNGRIQAWSYTYDGLGNLRTRSDLKPKTYDVLRSETFSYDSLDRLTTGTAYNQLGNITTRGGQAYAYTGTRPHAVTTYGTTTYQYDANGNLLGRDLATEFVWTAFNQPKSISRNGSTATFRYAIDRQRSEQVLGTTTTRYAGQGIEQVITPSSTETRFHIFAGGRRIAQVAVKDGQKTVTYLHGDSIGSVESITDALSAHSERLSFDAWGNPRDAADWAKPAPARTTGITRGFTDHESLEALGLIHMNGRLYDPQLARFISPDPIIQSPHSGQNRNRYAYVLNNPLKYTDPSGYQFQHTFYSNSRYEGAQNAFNNWASSGGNSSRGSVGNFDIRPFGGGYSERDGVPRVNFPRWLAGGSGGGTFQNANIQSSWQVRGQSDFSGGLGFANNMYFGGGSSLESTAQSRYDRFSFWAHSGLSVGGVVPGVGVIPDAIDWVYTAAELPFGKSSKTDLALATAGIGATFVPVVGDGPAAASKIANRVRQGVRAENGLTKASTKQLRALGFQDHHILSDKNVLTKNHDLLSASGFDLQSRSNKIWLPTDASLHSTRSLHIGRHWNSVSGNLASQMDEVLEFGRANGWNQQQFRSGLDGIIREERALLRSGERALNSIARPGAQ